MYLGVLDPERISLVKDRRILGLRIFGVRIQQGHFELGRRVSKYVDRQTHFKQPDSFQSRQSDSKVGRRVSTQVTARAFHRDSRCARAFQGTAFEQMELRISFVLALAFIMTHAPTGRMHEPIGRMHEHRPCAKALLSRVAVAHL